MKIFIGTEGYKIRIMAEGYKGENKGGANGQDDEGPHDDGDRYLSNDDDLDEEEGKEIEAEHGQKKGRKEQIGKFSKGRQEFQKQ